MPFNGARCYLAYGEGVPIQTEQVGRFGKVVLERAHTSCCVVCCVLLPEMNVISFRYSSVGYFMVTLFTVVSLFIVRPFPPLPKA